LKFELIFENFLKFSKRRRAVPLRPIWTIAAKLDQNRVLVSKFRQNRLTLKGRSAGQRQTDRQTRRWVLWLDCAPSSECPQFGMPPSFDRYLWPPCVGDADIILLPCGFLWSPYGIGQTIIFSCCDLFFLSSFFPQLISAAADWMSAILPHMVWP